ncbi:TrkH family potassium uptake protein [Marinicrinis sediminis]|uniref:TrkH family potassium uptake protein n=1 Tax=Marinicrinis sediminis TaxID=1652465 RepID=A0ABW5RG89_9BACL
MKFYRMQVTPVRAIVFMYFITALVSTILVYLPVFHRQGVQLSFIDALFTAVSALSVTGLTVVNTADTFNGYGYALIMTIFQLGGIGLMTLGTFIYLVIGRNIGLGARRLMMIDQNRQQLSGLVRILRFVLTFSLVIEFIGTILLTLRLYFTGFTDSLKEAFYYGSFHAVAAFTNAGFDTFGNSLRSFEDDYVIQLIIIVLILIGAIGFPVLIEVWEFIKHRKEHFRFSLFTKITVTTFVVLFIIGVLGIWLMENERFFADKSWHEKLTYSVFNSITARNGGLSTMDVADFGAPTQFLISTLMVIGASPSSMGGGIRTTTFAIVILAIIAYAKGNSEVRAFKRRISQEDVMKSFVVFSTAILIVVAGIICVDTFESQRHSLNAVIFEVSSAFGTTGLSMGITGDLDPESKSILILLMFMGRIGLLSLLLFFQRDKKTKIRYPEERVIIG